MSAFLYYLPGVETQASLPPAIKARGLMHAFETTRPQARECHCGPDGNAGFVATAGESEQLGYYPDKQTWRRIPASGAEGSDAWLGWWSESKPAPDGLMRGQPIDGHWTELADGQRWYVPVARACDDAGESLRFRVALPQRSVLGDDGQWRIGGVLPRHEKLWEIAERFWAQWNADFARADAGEGGDGGNVTVQLSFASAHEDAIAALATNYRLGPAECDALGILTPTHCVAILRAVIDWPTIARWLKKKAASQPFVSSSSLVGPADDTPATGPPSPTSGP